MNGNGFKLLVVAIWLVHVAILQLVMADEISVTVGKQESVFPVNYHGLRYFSDEPISILSTRPWSFTVVNTNKTVLMRGTTFDTAVPIQEVLSHGTSDAFDSSYAGISSIYYWKPKRQVLAFYHAEDSSGMQKIPYNDVLTAAHWSVALAVSNDGVNFTKVGQIITSSEKKDTTATDMRGLGDVSVCPDRLNTFLYAYYTDLSPQPKRTAQIGLARSKISSGGRPGTWYKFYNGSFDENGIGGKEFPAIPDAFHPNVTYIKSLDKYLMFHNVARWTEHQQGKAVESGMYFCYSADGIKWSDRQKLFTALDVPLVGKEYAAHPYFLLQKATAFSATGWLIYTYSPQWGETLPNVPHFMVRRRIQLKLSDDPSTRHKGSKATGSEGATVEQKGCPADAVAFGGHHYKVVWEPLSWTEAKEACTRMGGRLACIETDEEKTFLAELKGSGKVVWVGAQRVSPDTWEWLNGKSFDPSKMGRKAPPECDFVALHKKQTLHSRPVSGHDDRYPVKDIQGYICEWE